MFSIIKDRLEQSIQIHSSAVMEILGALPKPSAQRKSQNPLTTVKNANIQSQDALAESTESSAS